MQLYVRRCMRPQEPIHGKIRGIVVIFSVGVQTAGKGLPSETSAQIDGRVRLGKLGCTLQGRRRRITSAGVAPSSASVEARLLNSASFFRPQTIAARSQRWPSSGAGALRWLQPPVTGARCLTMAKSSFRGRRQLACSYAQSGREEQVSEMCDRTARGGKSLQLMTLANRLTL